jgi:sugar O-acyltransferase (sialic acid O-acetyltransferase NeuD family)
MWGASGHARVLYELTRSQGFQLVALFDNATNSPPTFLGVPVFIGSAGFERWRHTSTITGVHGVVAIGGARGRERLAILARFERNSVTPLTLVHPTAFVAETALLGTGTQVLAQAAIAVDARVGAACIVNTRAGVDHECVLGDGVHIGPGATLAGCVTVGDNTLVGAGAVVLPRVRLGRDVIVGAGAVVTRDVVDGGLVVGNPARLVRIGPQPLSPEAQS